MGGSRRLVIGRRIWRRVSTSWPKPERPSVPKRPCRCLTWTPAVRAPGASPPKVSTRCARRPRQPVAVLLPGRWARGRRRCCGGDGCGRQPRGPCRRYRAGACPRLTGLCTVEKRAVLQEGRLQPPLFPRDAILIKATSPLAGRARGVAGGEGAGHAMVAAETGVDRLDPFEEMLAVGDAAAVLPDNMAPDTLRVEVAWSAGGG